MILILFLFDFVWDHRTRTRSAFARNPQFPLQIGAAAGPAVDLPRQTRMGPVLLQGGESIHPSIHLLLTGDCVCDCALAGWWMIGIRFTCREFMQRCFDSRSTGGHAPNSKSPDPLHSIWRPKSHFTHVYVHKFKFFSFFSLGESTGVPRARRPPAQEPTGVHRDESHRSELGTAHTSCK